MSREDVVAVGIRLFAIYLALSVLWEAVGAAPLVFQDGWSSTAGFFIMLWLLGLAISGVLWVFPLTVARKLLPVMSEPRSEPQVDASVAMSLGLVLIGLWVLAYGLVNAAYWLTLMVSIHRMGGESYAWTPEQVAGITATVIELAVGVGLLFGAKGLKRLIYRFRYGTSVPMTPADARGDERPE